MAEQEVIKHTKAIYKIWKADHTNWKHKVQEIVIEIMIIVFAITLSLWLHNRSEQNHLREEEKSFLTGLKADLKSDTKEMESDKEAYVNVLKGYKYFTGVAYGATLQKDSLEKYRPYFYNSTQLNPNISRFEGLKASGKVDIIEDKELLAAVLELYQEDIPYVIILNERFGEYKKQRLEFLLDENLILDEKGNGNWEQVLRMPKLQNQLRKYSTIYEIINQYEAIIKKNKKILDLIDKQDL